MPSPCILVTGASGFLGGFVVAELRARGCEVRSVARSAGDAQVDLTQPGMVDAVLEALTPDWVLNLAAMARMSDCDRDPRAAQRANAELPTRLARRCGARLLHASTDLVFDGRCAPYHAASPPAPLSVYGSSKAEGEQGVLAHGGRVVRLPLLFGPDANGRGASAMVRVLLAAGQRLQLFVNEYRTPLHAMDAAAALADLLLQEQAPQLVHLAGPERISRYAFGERVALAAGLDRSLLDAVECRDGSRPRDVSLLSNWQSPRTLQAMLDAS